MGDVSGSQRAIIPQVEGSHPQKETPQGGKSCSKQTQQGKGSSSPNEMKYDVSSPRCVQDSQRNKEGETLRNGRKCDRGSPSPSCSKQKKCDEEGFPVVFETDNTTRMGFPLLIMFKT